MTDVVQLEKFWGKVINDVSVHLDRYPEETGHADAGHCEYEWSYLNGDSTVAIVNVTKYQYGGSGFDTYVTATVGHLSPRVFFNTTQPIKENEFRQLLHLVGLLATPS